MLALCRARLTIAAMPFDRWRHSLGVPTNAEAASPEKARRLAAHVERAAALLPFPTKCLPRAMALSWILGRNRISHSLVFAVRPADLRGSADDLHAWVEVNGRKLIGDLPGPWVETLRLGD
jgi:hypothetical protein